MSNQIYTAWLEDLMSVYFGITPNFTALPMDAFVCGVDANYTFNPAHAEIEDLGVTVTMNPVPLVDVDILNGVFSCADTVTDTSAQIGNNVHALVLFVANDDGSRLMAYIDTGQPTQLPTILVNGKLTIKWNPAGIFRI